MAREIKVQRLAIRKRSSVLSHQPSESALSADLRHLTSDFSHMKYVLITPAHNEERFITKTLESMVRKTVLPERWVVVDDGSTDRTAEIIESYAEDRPWIELLRRPQSADRTFVGKANALMPVWSW